MGTPYQALPGVYGSAQKSGEIGVLPSGWNGEPLNSQILPPFSHLCQAGVVYSTGMQVTSISNATFTTADALSATLGTAATATPIAGLYNPPGSGKNAHILRLNLQVVVTALQATGCGPLVWVGYPANNTITVASQLVPINRLNLQAKGSVCTGLSGLALTGLALLGNYIGCSGVSGGPLLTLSNLQTAVGLDTPMSPAVEMINGDMIVAPGCVLGLFCSTTPVAISAASGLTWAELPA